MSAQESTYLKVDGKFRGPYTVSQILSMYQRGLVTGDALFWQDGMEDPQPLTDLFRKPSVNWLRRGMIAAGLVLGVTLTFWLAATVFQSQLAELWHWIGATEWVRKLVYVLFYKDAPPPE